MEIYLCTIMLQNHKWTKDKTPDWPVEELIPRVKGLGYDGLELWGYHITDKTDAEMEAIREIAEKAGLKIGVLAPYFRFTESQESADASLQEAEKFIRFCGITGAAKIRVFSGGPGSADAGHEHWERGVRGIRQTCGMAEGKDITFVAETHANMLHDTVDSSLRLVKEVDHPRFKLNFQPATFPKEDPVVLFDQLAAHVDHIHASNLCPDPDVEKEKGRIPWEAFLGHLKGAGYDGTMSVEFVKDSTAPEAEYSLDTVLDNARKDREFIGSHF